MIEESLCKLCKSPGNHPKNVRDNDFAQPQPEANVLGVYKITVLFHKDGAIKLLAVCFFITVIICILVKVFKMHPKRYRKQFQYNKLFDIFNVVWIIACLLLLCKCLWMIAYGEDDMDGVVKLFPWYILIILSCCVIDIAEQFLPRPRQFVNIELHCLNRTEAIDLQCRKGLQTIDM